MTGLLKEEVKQALGGKSAHQQLCLFLRARPDQRAQQHVDSPRVVQGNVSGGIAGEQRGRLLVRARPLQFVQQRGYSLRVVDGGVGGGALGQRGSGSWTAPGTLSRS
jgi:hypothetical protein